MNRTAWEIFQAATLSLTRSGALKDRLTDAYRNHLSYVDEADLPKELREDFRTFSRAVTRERPLNRSEDAFRATVRKMSNGEIEAAAGTVVRMLCALQRGTAPARAPASILPLYIAAEPRAATESRSAVPEAHAVEA